MLHLKDAQSSVFFFDLSKRPQSVIMQNDKKNHKYRYILAFGSNVGDRIYNLKKSLILLKEHVHFCRQSQWHETKPLAHPVYSTHNHGNFVNFALEVFTSLEPDELYQTIALIEDNVGHPRERRWMPRSLDIDILFCAHNDAEEFSLCKPYHFFKRPDFNVPHIEYFNRCFWQDMVEKELNISKRALLKHFTQKHFDTEKNL